MPAGRVLSDVERGAWRPSVSTILVHLGDGRWSWQIPLFNEGLLSFGVVSRHGPVTREELDAVIEEHRSPQYTLRPHPAAADDHFGNVYQRGGIAQRARCASGERWILVGDAHFFADPVYSVGTALAINQAIEVATLLNEGGWDADRSEAYNRRAGDLANRAIRAYQFWYDDEVTRDDRAAKEVQHGFLVGSAFQVGIAEHYGAALSCARLADHADPEPEAFSGRFRASGEVLEAVLSEVTALLGAPDGAVAGWSLGGAQPSNSGVQLDWSSAGRPQLTMLLSASPGPAFRRVGAFALSYQSLWDGPYPMDAAGAALFDAVSASLKSAPDGWRDLLARYTLERDEVLPAGSRAMPSSPQAPARP